MFGARRIFVSGLILGGGLIGPAVSHAAASGTKLSLNGKSKGVASVDTSTNPSPVTFSSTGHLSHLGAFVALGNELFTPLGASPVLPYSITGTETVVARNGDELFGSVTGTGVNNSGATRGTNVVTITGGTGALAGATGSYTETYKGRVFGQVGSSLVGPLTTIIRGHISLAGGYCDPFQGPTGYCDPFPGSSERHHGAGRTHHQRHQRRNRGRK
jgi:hypothetical protein